MDRSNGVTVKMLDCLGTEIKHQEIRLNNAYKEVIASLSPERQEQLKSAQRAWLAYRQENCSFYADPDGGTMARVSANECFMSTTASRAKELETLRP